MEHLSKLSSRDRAKTSVILRWSFIADEIDVMIDDTEEILKATWTGTNYLLHLK